MIEDPAADHRLMGLALALGRRGLGRTWPNPSVGAVVVAPDGTILATAATAPGGRPHAEPVALAAAGAAARGSTLYVSLEPCSHHGRTPPCAEAIVAAGPARVVTALEDPDPRVAGRGHALLRAAGIAVTVGTRRDEAIHDHRGHLMRARAGRPWVTLKLARTPDGFAGERGRRLLVTGEGANARTHLLRAQADALLVGIGTVAADDPRLDVRLPGLADRSPIRVVVDPSLRLGAATRLVASAGERALWLLCGLDADPERERRLVEAGAVVLRCPGEGGLLDPAAALRALGAAGLTRVLCEGGPTLGEALAKARLVDDLVLMTGRTRLGRPGVPALGPHLQALVARPPVAVATVDGDTIATFEGPMPCSPAS